VRNVPAVKKKNQGSAEAGVEKGEGGVNALEGCIGVGEVMGRLDEVD